MSAKLQAQLRASGIRAVLTQPGAAFIDVARRERPHVAVLDRVDERMDAAQMEIQLLREVNQDVRIIAVSRKPSPHDAPVVEQGVFFYMTTPAAGELVRVVQAAARAVEPPATIKPRATTIVLAMVLITAMTGVARAAAPANIPAKQPKPNAKTDVCANAGCHANLLSNKFMHGPAAQQKCMACHEFDEPREHRFKLAADQSKLCGDCHAMKHRTVVHTPVQQGRCTGCHDPHGSEYRAMLRGDPTRGLCLSCHKQDFAQKKFVHGPVNSGACILCHEAHSAWQPKLLVDTPDKLCKSCHSELTPKGDLARHVHAPVQSGNCTACHDAHASNERFQLRTASAELCTSCHTDTAQLLTSSHVVHGALKEAGGCTSCHSPHFSQLPKLQKMSQPQSCLACHDKPLKSTEGSTLTDMVTLL
jgi:predicted CXXCH cytochrome family protein